MIVSKFCGQGVGGPGRPIMEASSCNAMQSPNSNPTTLHYTVPRADQTSWGSYNCPFIFFLKICGSHHMIGSHWTRNHE